MCDAAASGGEEEEDMMEGTDFECSVVNCYKRRNLSDSVVALQRVCMICMYARIIGKRLTILLLEVSLYINS